MYWIETKVKNSSNRNERSSSDARGATANKTSTRNINSNSTKHFAAFSGWCDTDGTSESLCPHLLQSIHITPDISWSWERMRCERCFRAKAAKIERERESPTSDSTPRGHALPLSKKKKNRTGTLFLRGVNNTNREERSSSIPGDSAGDSVC